MDQNKIRKKAISLISENFGESTAKLYKEYYQNKELNEIKLSIKELLTELVGPKNAKKQLTRARLI